MTSGGNERAIGFVGQIMKNLLVEPISRPKLIRQNYKGGLMKQPNKVIILAAGLGTRFLPQTKFMPKEMLPIIDKPVIQLVVEDDDCGRVTDIIIVTGSTKRAIEDHFDRSDAMEAELREKGKMLWLIASSILLRWRTSSIYTTKRRAEGQRTSCSQCPTYD